MKDVGILDKYKSRLCVRGDQLSIAIACGLNPDQLYRVNKFLYGLPDAGRAYYIAYSELLIANGYTRSQSDPCLFYSIKDEIWTYVWCHVDDMMISSTDESEIKKFEEKIQVPGQIFVYNVPATREHTVYTYIRIVCTLYQPEGW